MNNEREIEINAILNQCGEAEINRDYEKLIELSDRVFELDSKNPIAFGFKSFAYLKLKQFDKSLELLDEACKLYPDNYYLKNNLAMYYYDLGEYEKSLECCEEGLKIKQYSWLCENKVRALIKLDRLSQAIEFYETSSVYTDMEELLFEGGKYAEAVEYCLDICTDDRFKFIDKVKDSMNGDDRTQLGGYYLDWIYKIIHVNDVRTGPDCGGELIEIVWELPLEGLLRKAQRDEIFLGGCCIPLNPPNYHCKKCDKEVDLGVEGLQIECEDYKLHGYIEYKIKELISQLRGKSLVVIRSLDTLKKELKGFDNEEFKAFIKHLIELDCLYQPREGYIKLVGHDDFRCAKEYLDEGKFAAPKWLAFPQFSQGTIGWRMGAGEDYAMNHPHHSKEYRKLFPMPKYWEFNLCESQYGPHPPIGYFWNEDGKPKYPKVTGGIEVNDFITLDDEKEFESDAFRFKSIAHAELLSKYLYFEKYGRKDKDLEGNDLKLTPEEEKTWNIYRYSVLLNASYFKIMQDSELKQKLLETGDEPLIYISDDEENLFGRALMELRDEIRRLCKNEDLIDWEYSEYLKYKPWWD